MNKLPTLFARSVAALHAGLKAAGFLLLWLLGCVAASVFVGWSLARNIVRGTEPHVSPSAAEGSDFPKAA